ncbi:hypothetical protein [Bacillus marinisedimentorum]|uniref:hypothetical protein n=1 Tax=Bacillus marinisedimentorum TaxID=1821260 RepID=UPI0007DF64AF|nr:hypothetical protein [Bacillus marinisedimentorum]
MLFPIVMIVLSIASFFFAVRKQRPQLLLVPLAALVLYVTVEVAMVPAPFFDTVKFIFNLR